MRADRRVVGLPGTSWRSRPGSRRRRLLRVAGESQDRRRTHPARSKTELMATRPNDVSWDITKLAGSERRVLPSLRRHPASTAAMCPAGSATDARSFCETFFDYYTHQHRHRALGLHTPASVHFGTGAETRTQRAVVLRGRLCQNPLRFAATHAAPAAPVRVDQQALAGGAHTELVRESCLQGLTASGRPQPPADVVTDS